MPGFAASEAMLSEDEDGRESKMLSGLCDADEDESCSCKRQILHNRYSCIQGKA